MAPPVHAEVAQGHQIKRGAQRKKVRPNRVGKQFDEMVFRVVHVGLNSRDAPFRREFVCGRQTQCLALQ